MPEIAPQQLSQNPLYDDGLPMVCAQCLYYIGNDKTGMCRGAPPTAIVIGMTRDLAGNTQPQLGSWWPIVSSDRFCGAFKADRLKALEHTAPNGFLVTPEPGGRA